MVLSTEPLSTAAMSSTFLRHIARILRAMCLRLKMISTLTALGVTFVVPLSSTSTPRIRVRTSWPTCHVLMRSLLEHSTASS